MPVFEFWVRGITVSLSTLSSSESSDLTVSGLADILSGLLVGGYMV